MREKTIARVQEAVARRIHFECSLTSNYITAAVPSVAEHPLPRMISNLAGNVGLNTDDPGLFGGITLVSECERAVNECKLTVEQVKRCQRAAFEASFVPPDEKNKVAHLFESE